MRRVEARGNMTFRSQHTEKQQYIKIKRKDGKKKGKGRNGEKDRKEESREKEIMRVANY